MHFFVHNSQLIAPVIVLQLSLFRDLLAIDKNLRAAHRTQRDLLVAFVLEYSVVGLDAGAKTLVDCCF